MTPYDTSTTPLDPATIPVNDSTAPVSSNSLINPVTVPAAGTRSLSAGRGPVQDAVDNIEGRIFGGRVPPGDALAVLRRDIQPGGEKFVAPLCKKFVKNYERLIERGGSPSDDYVISVFLGELPSHVRSRMRKYQGSKGSRQSLMDVMNNAKAAERDLRKRANEFKETVSNVADRGDHRSKPFPPRYTTSKSQQSESRVACVEGASSAAESRSDHGTVDPGTEASDDEYVGGTAGACTSEDPFDIFCSLGTGALIATTCGNVSASSDNTDLPARDYEGIRSDIEAPSGQPYNLTRSVDIKCGKEVLFSPPDAGNPVTLIRPDIATALIKDGAARGPFQLRGTGFKLSGVTGGQAIIAKTFIVMKVYLKPLGSSEYSLCSFVQALIAPGLTLKFLLGNNTLHSWNWRSFWRGSPNLIVVDVEKRYNGGLGPNSVPKEAIRSETEDRWRIALPLERSMGLKDKTSESAGPSSANCAAVTLIPQGGIADVTVTVGDIHTDMSTSLLLLSPLSTDLPDGIEVPECIVPAMRSAQQARIRVRNRSSADYSLEPGTALGHVSPVSEDFSVHDMELIGVQLIVATSIITLLPIQHVICKQHQHHATFP
ncbi:DNA-(apurinic or apyrimidinic site) lyase [Perkinsus olseni]|uniref:DNA-(Apurinic or apyrimidinic site) lyase n=1 Tax=Perkinsus olseni TaxID=32597 RepID=A0A7J6N5E5_PEROL|nr:DNA-(apurinic or apyrimidinic site) lyase [Perkinsus olseni]